MCSVFRFIGMDVKKIVKYWYQLCSEGLEKWITIDKTEMERWEDQPIFYAHDMNEAFYRIILNSKCYAMILITNCIMDETVVKYIHLYSISSLVSAGGLMFIFSPLLMWRVIPIIFFTVGLVIQSFIAAKKFRTMFFFIYCVVGCLEVHGFEFFFDLYVIACFVIEAVRSIYFKKTFETYVPLIVLSECVIWFLPMNMLYRVLINFVWLVVYSLPYTRTLPVFFLYFFVTAAVLFVTVNLQFRLELFDCFFDYLMMEFEKYILNATLVVRP